MSRRFSKRTLLLIAVVATIAIPFIAIYVVDGAAVALAPGLGDTLQ